MGVLGTIGKIIAFPFKVISWLFRRRKKEEQQTTNYPASLNQPTTYPTDATADNLKAKVDLMLSQVDSLKLEYEALNQRIQNIERMVREIYVMAKS